MIAIDYIHSPATHSRGDGILGGHPPLVPEGPDGRARKLNVPARVRILVYEKIFGVCVRSTLSAPDGTWEVRGLNPDHHYTVIAYDDTEQLNAAIQDWIRPHVPGP